MVCSREGRRRALRRRHRALRAAPAVCPCRKRTGPRRRSGCCLRWVCRRPGGSILPASRRPASGPFTWICCWSAVLVAAIFQPRTRCPDTRAISDPTESHSPRHASQGGSQWAGHRYGWIGTSAATAGWLLREWLQGSWSGSSLVIRAVDPAPVAPRAFCRKADEPLTALSDRKIVWQ